MEEKIESAQAVGDKNIRIQNKNDWFLQSLVKLTAQIPSIGITIVSHGFLISGDLIDGTDYFNEFGKEFGEMFPDNGLYKVIPELFTEVGKKVREKSDDNLLPTFLHLKNAKFFHNNGEPIPTNRGVLWRGRLSEVSGFYLGNLS